MAISERLRAEMANLSEESQAEVRRLAGQDAQRRFAQWRARREPINADLAARGIRFNAADEIRTLRDGQETED